MPNYYNGYSYTAPYLYNNTAWGNGGQNNLYGTAAPQATQYMINVDGEVGAKAWQMPNNLAPNTVIPLFDLDGEHIYFRSVDAYGRMNPLRKGRVVFDEETQNLPQGQSRDSNPSSADPEFNRMKDEISELKDEIRQMRQAMQQNSQLNQNGNNPNNRQNRGGRNE